MTEQTSRDDRQSQPAVTSIDGFMPNVSAMQADLQTGVMDFRAEIYEELALFRGEVRKGLDEFRADLQNDITAFRMQMQRRLAEQRLASARHRADVQTRFEALITDIQEQTGMVMQKAATAHRLVRILEPMTQQQELP